RGLAGLLGGRGLGGGRLGRRALADDPAGRRLGRRRVTLGAGGGRGCGGRGGRGRLRGDDGRRGGEGLVRSGGLLLGGAGFARLRDDVVGRRLRLGGGRLRLGRGLRGGLTLLDRDDPRDGRLDVVVVTAARLDRGEDRAERVDESEQDVGGRLVHLPGAVAKLGEQA